MATTEELIRRAEDTLSTARYGFEDLIGKNKSRRLTGLRNLIVFGRSLTFVLQNMRTPLGKDRFDSWYLPHQTALKNDAVMSYFVTLRNELEKQGRLPVSTAVKINNFSTDMLSQFQKPPGTKAFFMGDQIGGSGWEVELLDGSSEKYYIDLPSSIVEVKQFFNELPVPDDHELKSKSIEDLSEHFLNTLEKILDSAKEEFLNVKTQKINGRSLPSYMRVIK